MSAPEITPKDIPNGVQRYPFGRLPLDVSVTGPLSVSPYLQRVQQAGGGLTMDTAPRPTAAGGMDAGLNRRFTTPPAPKPLTDPPGGALPTSAAPETFDRTGYTLHSLHAWA